LALRTPMGSPLSENIFTYRTATAAAQLPFPSIHFQPQLKGPLTIPGIDVIGDTGSLPADGFAQNFSNRRTQLLRFFRKQPVTGGMRTDPGSEERFIRINIANPRNQPLIQQNGLDRDFPLL